MIRGGSSAETPALRTTTATAAGAEIVAMRLASNDIWENHIGMLSGR
jgi:hypothetical protein